MYELDTYLEAQEDFPNELLTLETEKGIAKHLKTEILNKKIWYTLEGSTINKPFAIKLENVKKIIQQNKRGIKPPISRFIDDIPEPENIMNVGTADIDPKKSNKQQRNRNYKRPYKKSRNRKPANKQR